MCLKGKTAVVTGCLQGIGRSVMRLFAENEVNIIACAYQQTEEFEGYIAELAQKNGVIIKAVYFDMADNDAIKNAAREIQKLKMPLDILVNVAGITRDANFQMVTAAQMEETFQVNFFSQVWFAQYITKLLLRNNGGSIVFTSSISGLDGNEGQLAYAASKAAICAAVKTMSKELAPKGIRVNAVAPGVIKTPMTDVLPQEILDHKIESCSLQRIGLPEEVAQVVLYLCSEQSSYVTGQIIRVDGGIG